MRDKEREKRVNRITALVFLAFMFALMVAVCIIVFPKGELTSLHEMSHREIESASGSHKLLCIEPGEYRVLEQIYERDVVERRGKGASLITRAYYSVQIRDKNGEEQVIVVRTNKGSKNLEKNDNYRLEGFIADMPDEVLEKADTRYLSIDEVIFNDAPWMNSRKNAMLAGGAAVVFLAGIVLILIRSR